MREGYSDQMIRYYRLEQISKMYDIPVQDVPKRFKLTKIGNLIRVCELDLD